MNLQLNDNSITSLIEMKNNWMPLLKQLELNQNCIETVITLNGLFNVEKISIENNNLCDLESIWDFKTFKFLHEIFFTNNPILNEDKIEIDGFNLMTEDNVKKLKVLKLPEENNNLTEFDRKFNGSVTKITKFIEIHKMKALGHLERFQILNQELALVDLDEL